MKKILIPFVLLLLLLSACGQPAPAEEDDTIHILATTYPVYLFTTAIANGVEGVEVELLVNQQTSCLHDYTLTVNDMKAIERADVIVMNGVGLEDFMSDALAASDAVAIDCSEGVALLPATGHHDHDHGHDHDHDHGHYDAHIWMSPANAVQMCANITEGLAQYEPKWAESCQHNLAQAQTALEPLAAGGEVLAALEQRNLITFHDGFQYFAHENDLILLKSIEEEEGSTASAADIKEMVALIREYDIPAIFTEKNGSDATAKAISRETGCAVYELDMMMSGEGVGIQSYIDTMEYNINTIMEALG